MKNILYLVLLILIGAAIYYFVKRNDGNSLNENAVSDFAIADTASIGKVVIDDGRGIATLERGDDGFWSLNDTLTAMPHHVEVLLKTFSNTGVQSPVSKSSSKSVMKLILGDTRVVEIYNRDDEWIKTWYVGRATPSSQGTYALVETPEQGRSSEPFVIEMRGFRGYLTTRFHSNVKDWRWTGLYHHPSLDIKQIKVETPRDSEQGYTIDVIDKMNGDYQVSDYTGTIVPIPDERVAGLVEQYRNVNVEHFNTKFKPAQIDSLLLVPPYYKITVTDLKGDTETADIWYRPTNEATKGRMRDRAPELDPERLLVYFKGELAMGQRLTFDRILYTLSEF